MRVRVSYAATIAVILMVSQAAIAGELFPKVVVAPAPLKPYVDEILRGHGEAHSLLKPGQDAHDFALSPSQAKMLAEADMLIVPDLGMTPVLRRLAAKNKRLRVIELSGLDGAAALPYGEENPWLEAAKETAEEKAPHKEEAHDHHDHEDPDHGATDPHLWLDPERMAAMAKPLAKALSATAVEAGPTLTENARRLAEHLRRDVIPELRAMLSRPARTVDAVGKTEIPFITYHAAYQYFLERFGLAHTGEITQRPEEMMGAKTTTTLIRSAEAQRVRCLIGEQENVLMQRIAKSSGARIILLSPEQLPARETVDAIDWIRNDYDRFLYVTAKAFAGCL